MATNAKAPAPRVRLNRALNDFRFDGDALAAWALAFAAVFYLAMRNGGFGTAVSGQFGLLMWWAVLLIALAGLAPRLSAWGWVGVGLLLAMAAWTALGIGGSESQERTLAEVGRVATYAGALLLALVVQARAGSRPIVSGLACAIGLVTVLAVLSRLHAEWFPHNDQIEFLDTSTRRLSYPLNYWNALATLMAVGFMLLLAVGSTARTTAGKALAMSVAPVSCLGIYLCVSRGGVILIVIGTLIYLALADDRLSKAVSTVIAGAGGGVLILAASARDAVQSGLDTVAARSEGGEMIVICMIVMAGVALLHLGVDWLARHERRPRWSIVPRRQAAIGAGAALALACTVFVVAGGVQELGDRWEAFKEPPAKSGAVTDANAFARLQDSAGQGRYQYWESAIEQYKSDKLRGTGGATFALWWPRHATVEGPVLDAHNLYLQTLGELGVVGVLVLLGFVAMTLIAGVRLAIRTTADARVRCAAATAGLATFWLDGTVEWVWQMPVLAVVTMFLAAVLLGRGTIQRGALGMRWRAALAGVAVVAIVPIAMATSVAAQLDRSQAAVRAGELGSALDLARSASRVQPGAAGPKLQEALVLEQAGDLRRALTLSGEAVEREPTNWKPWLVRARIAQRVGRRQAALRAFRTARRLNPQSEVFVDCQPATQGGPC